MKASGWIGLLSSVLGVAAIHYRSVNLWYGTMVAAGIFGELANSVCYALFADSISGEERNKATSTMGIIANVAQAVGPMMTFVSMLWIGNNWTTAGLEKILMFGFAVVNPICCLECFLFVKAPYESTGDDDDEEEPENAEYLRRKGACAVPWLVA